MQRSFLFAILILISCCLFKVKANDLSFGEWIAPPLTVPINQPFNITVEIKNINIEAAVDYTINCKITDLTNNQIVFDLTDSGPPIEKLGMTTFTFSETYTPESVGGYFFDLLIESDEDIYLANNKITCYIESVAPPECKNSRTWHPASAITIIEDLKFFPDEEDFQLGGVYMRPGDAIGISCLAEDNDFLIETCSCGEKTSSRSFGPYKDNLKYEWSIEGENEVGGELITAPGSGNSAMYQLPFCIELGFEQVDLRTRIKCTIKNDPGSSKTVDEELSGYVTIRVKYPSKAKKPLVYGYVTGFGVNKDQEFTTAIDETVCSPEEPIWAPTPQLTAGGEIIVTEAQDFCPDYITLLSAEKSDSDMLVTYCQENDECGPNDTTVAPVDDPLEYEWTVINGKGSFPLGNKGQSVVFWKSSSEDAHIQCTIRDSRLQGGDDIISITKMVTKAKSPKAYITVGSQHCFNNPITGARVGQCSVFVRSAKHMVTAYQTAGYLVEYSESASIEKITEVLEDPCYQGFCMVGHGAKGLMTYPEPPGGFPPGYDPEAPPSFKAADLREINIEKWDCNRHPTLRDLRLMGCETARDERSWMNNTHNACFFGFEEAITFMWLEDISEAHGNGKITVEKPYNRSMP